MKRTLIYIGIIAGSFVFGFISFYYLMPFIIKHSKTIEVPYLENMSVEKAKSFLSSLDLQYVISDSVNSNEVAKGCVVRSHPSTKEDVKIGSVIKLVVSKGPKKVRLPDIIGLSRDEAVDSLSKYGITNRVFINYPVQKKDRVEKVIKTKPTVEDSLEEGGMLTIYIGKEKRKVFLMPNLNGMKIEEAEEEIAKYDLILGEIRWIEEKEERVIQQSPLPGVEVTFKDTVKLVVGRGKR